ncbi:hypothetical protein SBRCBS47491_002659 [Sporothrix bragantina]|uniref:Uncharacterized protein n=1 Tax=Sporothrix bragantina TaxID=671064 RepID=A0ABP0B8Q3_9PEZI
MSTRTATATSSRQASRNVGELQLLLTDYAIHRTGAEVDTGTEEKKVITKTKNTEESIEPQTDIAAQVQEGLIDPTVEPHPRVAGVVQPAWWPSDRYRAVPEYAPINRNLDWSRRPIGTNPVISFLLTMTFTGNGILQWYAKIWRSTVGVLNDELFRYPVGGEY